MKIIANHFLIFWLLKTVNEKVAFTDCQKESCWFRKPHFYREMDNKSIVSMPGYLHGVKFLTHTKITITIYWMTPSRNKNYTKNNIYIYTTCDVYTTLYGGGSTPSTKFQWKNRPSGRKHT